MTFHLVVLSGISGNLISGILVRNFWQLKPVPSPLDPGNSVISLQLLDKVFSHCFDLWKVLRQDDEDKLKDDLDFLRGGQCSEEVEQYLQSLARDLDSVGMLVGIQRSVRQHG